MMDAYYSDDQVTLHLGDALDVVAEAICNAESYDKDSPTRWECQSENFGRPKYRRMAQAAIDSLQLKEGAV